MEILTYPTGLLIGLLPVVVDLGSAPRPARLLLDGRPACTVTAASPSCLVDLGLDPREHRLELVRTDAAGAVTERVERWINRPGIEAEIIAKGGCDARARQCEFSLAWAHPYRLDPDEFTIRLDDQVVYHGAGPRGRVRVAFPGAASPRVLIAEARFPDGRTAVRADVLSAANRASAGTALRTVPIVLGPDSDDTDLAERLRASGWNVRAVEAGAPDVLFVVEPRAFQTSGALLREVRLRAAQSADLLGRAASIQMIIANESLTRLDLSSSRGGRPAWLSAMFAASRNAGTPRRLRTADAVATAAYLLGATPRPRAVVLVLADRETEASSLSAAQARRYLSETLVPLVVWRVGDAASPDWPENRRLKADHDLYDSMVVLVHDLEKQRIAWLETGPDVDEIPSLLPDGIRLAGRTEVELEPEFAPPARAPDATLPARSVFALAADPSRAGRVFAGTDAGLFESRDAGESWKAATPGGGIAVYAIALAHDAQGPEPVIGTSGTPRPMARGDWLAVPVPEVLAIIPDPFEEAHFYAGSRNGVLKSLDGGVSWSDASGNLSRIFALALAADPKRRGTVYAATAGHGVYRTTNGGASWEPRGGELSKTVVRALALDPADSERVYAGTDGGVWRSRNGGRTWEASTSGLPRAPVYAVTVDPRGSSLWAGSARGLFHSLDGGSTWKPAPAWASIPVASLALDVSENALYVGTLGDGFARVSLDREGSPAH